MACVAAGVWNAAEERGEQLCPRRRGPGAGASPADPASRPGQRLAGTPQAAELALAAARVALASNPIRG